MCEPMRIPMHPITYMGVKGKKGEKRYNAVIYQAEPCEKSIWRTVDPIPGDKVKTSSCEDNVEQKIVPTKPLRLWHYISLPRG